ncbi:ABC transporter substrate-binding protein [Nocardiopsis sp. N85]|uniref:ABC transporter substrate-binding protein n=1 Tax=Nocardiopsis sp. N85 TaxID=3029400 RepID=UPI00237F7B25|nr:ABC transporter substrate-binding protein [Nocardiopsis sp. N85]MDE3720620.1 ABC transporter substrate-binding protein [Nocardiopsis sp. N85]
MSQKKTLVVMALAALTLSGCANGEGAGSGDSDTLTIGTILPPTTFDLEGREWGNASPFYQAVYDTLLSATPDGDVEPRLATEWSYDEDGTVLTMELRDDVTFSDGSEFTARVARDNLEAFQESGATASIYLADVTGVEATGDHTLEITLAEPDPAFLNYLARDPGVMVSGEALGDDSLAGEPVGSGPYLLDTSATVTGTGYVYTRNPDHWDTEAQHYDRLVINVYEEPTAALNAIKAGEVDAAQLASNDNRPEVEAAGWDIHTVELDFQGLLLFDRAGDMNPALSDPRVRQAINHAVDRYAMLEALQGGYGSVTSQVFPEHSMGFDPELEEYYDYDPERARELLEEAGYGDGFVLEMPMSTALGSTPYTLLEQQLNDIGIVAEHTDSGNNFFADMLAPKYPAAMMSLEQNPDWQLVRFMVAPGAQFNPLDSQTDELDALIEELQYGADQEQAARAINTYLVEEAWFAPFYRVDAAFATSEGVEVDTLATNAYPNLYDIRPQS